MLKIQLCLLALLLGLAIAEETRKSYKGYKVYLLTLETQAQLDFLNRMNDDLLTKDLAGEVELWTERNQLTKALPQTVNMMVSPREDKEFLRLINGQTIQHKVEIPDLSVLLEEESYISPSDQRVISEGGMTWTAYHRYSTIERFLETLATNYSAIVEKSTLGKSYEGRNLYLMKIGKPRADGKTKPAVWMDAQIHAREWIACATVTYMMNKLVTEYGLNETVTRMVDQIDWYVLPVINVDGYEFTHTNERLNRLTRQINPFSSRIGADPNRNYDHKWMLQGATQQAGTEIYAGPFPFSEPENLHLTEAVLQRRNQIKTLLTFHSAVQMWLLPWGYDLIYPDDYQDLMQMGVRATDALTAVYGTRYAVGSSTELLGAAAGATDDWGKAKAGVKYSVTVELRNPRGFGAPSTASSFILPPEQIIPSGLETFEAIRVVGEIVYQEFGPTLN
ncbi:Carboxypeptidase B [Hypsibius exemplaris]|uniref:Carboxypeptidase B n=1 Tax=Hypsibius exemplaris TaxID=2072580 RepID=A0A9X6N9T7_HYPEX|nr:Carboxypeptidase B [Hypsibius exemplaris]